MLTLLLDVDGPLNPWAAKAHRRPPGYTTHRMRPTGWDHPRAKPLRVWLNPAHGPALAALPYNLVWATTWAHEANEWISPHLGLPTDLPHITWTQKWAHRSDGTYWKTHDIVRWAAGRPLVWVDDETTAADTAYLDAHHPGFARILHVNPAHGLRDDDFATLHTWAWEWRAAQGSSVCPGTRRDEAAPPLKQRGS